MVNNIFLVYTEYHIMQSINIILHYYNDCNNIIFYRESKRIKDFNSINCNYHFEKINESKDYSAIFSHLMSFSPDNYFFFQEMGGFNVYLAYSMHKNGVKVNLVQDGLKPYVEWHKKHAFISSVKDTFNVHKEIHRCNGIFYNFSLLNFYKYGNFYYINSLWLTHPKSFPFIAKEIKEIPTFTDSIIEVLNKQFSFVPSSNNNELVLIIGQNKGIDNYKEDVQLIENIIDRYNGRRILFKPHPNTIDVHLNSLKELSGLEFVAGQFPVELLILNLSNSIIISGYSTSALTYNPTCKYFWTHKLYKKNKVSSQYTVNNPTDYIHEIDCLDEL